MEIEYQRNLKSSYMVLIEEESRLNLDGQLAEKMLARNRIAGLLDYVSMEYQGKMTFWYKITGTTSLSDWLKVHFLDHTLLKNLFAGIIQLQEELPRYYLKENHVVLKADQIFVDGSGNHFKFCYEPMWDACIVDSMEQFMEELLPLIDHQDNEAVTLGYGVYECSKQKNGSLWDCLLAYAENDHAKTTSVSNEQKDESNRENNVENIKNDKNIEEKVKIKTKEKTTRMENHSFVSSMKERVTSFRQKDNKPQTASVFHFEPEEEPVEESENPTVCLGELETAQGRLLYQGTQGQESFYIDKESFLIGGNQKADGVLSASGISRNHARITKEKDSYCLMDLNSRNGTYLNGQLLDYKEKCEIHPGDRIRFATQEYVFY